MKRTLAMLVVALGLLVTVVGCSGSSPDESPSPDVTTFVPKEQQGVMARLALAGGYGIGGVPQYEKTRWTMNVRLEGCGTSIKLAGNETPEPVSPTSFVVHSIGGVPFTDISPGTNASNMSAATLKSTKGVKERLDCAT